MGNGGMCSGGTADGQNSLASGVRDKTSIVPSRGLKTCQPTWGDDVRPTDVAGVDDMCHPGQALLSIWT
jgi:hypothetical protein